MRTTLSLREIGLAAVWLGLGALNAVVWARLADLGHLPKWHLEMIGGSALAPNQYRPLTPWLAEGLRHAIPGGGVQTAYLILRGLVTALALICFDRYLRVWFAPAAAAAGALCLGAILPFTYLHVVQESDPLNLLVFVLAYWALARDRDPLLLPLVLVGTLNRETTAMIPALYLLARSGTRPPLHFGRGGACPPEAGELSPVPGRAGEAPPLEAAWRTAALAAGWAAVYGAMLLGYGVRSYYCEPLTLGLNLSSWAPTVYVFLLFGPMWVLAAIAARRGPLLLRRAIWLLPPYVILHYVVALAWEVRLFLPLAPLIIPLAWWVLFPEARLPAANDPQACSCLVAKATPQSSKR